MTSRLLFQMLKSLDWVEISYFGNTLPLLAGMRHTVSVEDLINYLKKWCVKPLTQEQSVKDELEGADFTSTVEHIHQVYSFLWSSCSQNRLKELFQHNPAVFIEKNRLVLPTSVSLVCSHHWQRVTLCPFLLQAGWKVVFRPFLPPKGGVLG